MRQSCVKCGVDVNGKASIAPYCEDCQADLIEDRPVCKFCGNDWYYWLRPDGVPECCDSAADDAATEPAHV